MAATNFTPIILYHTTTASAAPTAGNLNNGELAINITDGKLFYKDNGGTVQVIATKGTGTIGGSNTQVQYNSSGALAGSANFTFNGTTATINTLNLTNALGTAYGGTALTTYTQGDLVYASAANTLAKLGIGANTYILTSTGSVPQWSAPSAVTVATANNLAGGAAGSVPYQSGASTTTFLSIGSAGQVLTSSGSAPQWSNLSSLGVTSLSFGTTGLTPSTATQGAITVAGTLATTNGGTGLTSFTANGVVYASSSSALATGSALTFNGTLQTISSASNGAALELLRLSNTGTGNNTQSQLTFYAASTNYAQITGGYAGAPSLIANVAAGGYQAWQVAASEALRLTSTSLYTASGINVGIGTNLPVDSLTVVKSTVDGASTATFINSGTPTTTTQSFRLRLGSFAGFIANPQLSPYVESLCTDVGNGYSALAFGTYGSSGVVERGRFSSDGTFRVKGAGTAGSTDAVQFSGSAPANSLFLDSSGRLGVGGSATTSVSVVGATATTLGFSIAPSGWNNAKHRLTVPTSGDTSVWSFNWDGAAVDFSGYATSSITIGQGNVYIATGATNTAPSTVATFNSTGVGIGAAPAYKLDVVGGYVRSQSASGTNNGYLLTTNSANSSARNWAVLSNCNVFGDFSIRTSTTLGGDPVSGTDRFYLDNTGSAALGATAVARVGSDTTLYVQGGSFASVNFGVGGAYAGAGITLSSSNHLQFRISGGTAATLIGTNEFGIGVVPTLYKGQLQVGGTGNDMIVGNQSRIGGNAGNGFFVVNGYYDQATTTGKFLNNGYSGQLDFAIGTGIWTLGATAASGTAGAGLATAVPLITVSEGDTLALQGATQSTGTGIAFPATQNASSNANTLDDYEEGDLIPGWNGGTLTVYGCKYVKVGRLVSASYDILFGSSASSATAIIDLPFNATGSGTYAGGYINYTDKGSANYTLNIDNGFGNPRCLAFRESINSSSFNCSNIAGSRWIFTVTYYCAS